MSQFQRHLNWMDSFIKELEKEKERLMKDVKTSESELPVTNCPLGKAKDDFSAQSVPQEEGE